MKKITLHTDGGARGNPGKAGIGYVLYNDEGTIVSQGKKYIGIATNNEAEYQGLLEGVKHIRMTEPDCTQIEIKMDSELIVKQMKGEYKIKQEHLQKYAKAVKEELAHFESWTFIHVRREFNKLADKLVNQAIDEA